MTIRPFLAAVGFLLLLDSGTPAAEPLPLKDGNFLRWENGQLAEWKVSIGARSGGSLRSALLPIEGGGISLSGKESTGDWNFVSQRLEVGPGAMLRIRFEAETEGLKLEPRQFNNCYVGLMAVGADGKRLGLAVRNLFETEWAPGQMTMLTPEGTTAVDVAVFLSKTGSLHVRKVEVERLEAGDSFDVLVDEIDRYYSFLALKKIDWRARAAEYAERARNAKTADEFAQAIQPLLAEMKDLHVSIEMTGGKRVPTFVSPADPNFNARAAAGKLKDIKQIGRMGFTGRTDDGFGYVAIGTLQADEKTAAEMLAAFDALLDSKGLIIDLRVNGGGSEPLAQQFASRLISEPLEYAQNQFRNGARYDDLITLGTRIVQPGKNPAYTGPIVGLIGPGCVSSGEGFALMLKALPNATLIGQPTRGASGNPQPVLLPNWLKVHYSTWVPLDMDGKAFEGTGIAPDQLVEDDPTGVKGLDAAIEKLRASGK
jgi:hypothetical protein